MGVATMMDILIHFHISCTSSVCDMWVPSRISFWRAIRALICSMASFFISSSVAIRGTVWAERREKEGPAAEFRRDAVTRSDEEEILDAIWWETHVHKHGNEKNSRKKGKIFMLFTNQLIIIYGNRTCTKKIPARRIRLKICMHMIRISSSAFKTTFSDG